MYAKDLDGDLLYNVGKYAEERPGRWGYFLAKKALTEVRQRFSILTLLPIAFDDYLA